MAIKEKQTPSTTAVQVFELTMDNSEDQDELNRQLHKPGEPAILAQKGNDQSTTVSSEKKSRPNA
jgi:hypothetical protein